MRLRLIRLINSVLNTAEVTVLVIVILYAVYSLWDNQQIYQQAENLQQELLSFKNQEDEETELDFDDLQQINPDVCAWITMDGTRVDYPVLQGENNFEYLSLDVYGEFSLAGSIYLDSRNDSNYDHAYSLLHGHHMNQGRMFGDLDLYKDRGFFDENKTGVLHTPDCSYQLDVIAYMLIESNDSIIFAPQRWETDASEVLTYISNDAVYINEDVYDRAIETGGKLLCLATCSTETTEARTAIICLMTMEEPAQEVEN